MKKAKNDRISQGEQLFQEEVAESELHSKLGVDDHIYVRNRSSLFENPILLLLTVLLVFTALFALFYGIISLDKGNGREIGVIKNEYRLTVVHSDESYGGSIKSFKDYDTSNKAFSYTFSVSNKNSVNLGYAISVQKGSATTVNMSDVNYKLLKNDTTVATGKLSDKKSNKIFDATVVANFIDEYEIRLWSDGAVDGALTFRIKVLV